MFGNICIIQRFRIHLSCLLAYPLVAKLSLLLQNAWDGLERPIRQNVKIHDLLFPYVKEEFAPLKDTRPPVLGKRYWGGSSVFSSLLIVPQPPLFTSNVVHGWRTYTHACFISTSVDQVRCSIIYRICVKATRHSLLKV